MVGRPCQLGGSGCLRDPLLRAVCWDVLLEPVSRGGQARLRGVRRVGRTHPQLTGLRSSVIGNRVSSNSSWGPSGAGAVDTRSHPLSTAPHILLGCAWGEGSALRQDPHAPPLPVPVAGSGTPAPGGCQGACEEAS